MMGRRLPVLRSDEGSLGRFTRMPKPRFTFWILLAAFLSGGRCATPRHSANGLDECLGVAHRPPLRKAASKIQNVNRGLGIRVKRPNEPSSLRKTGKRLPIIPQHAFHRADPDVPAFVFHDITNKIRRNSRTGFPIVAEQPVLSANPSVAVLIRAQLEGPSQLAGYSSFVERNSPGHTCV